MNFDQLVTDMYKSLEHMQFISPPRGIVHNVLAFCKVPERSCIVKVPCFPNRVMHLVNCCFQLHVHINRTNHFQIEFVAVASYIELISYGCHLEVCATVIPYETNIRFR